MYSVKSAGGLCIAQDTVHQSKSPKLRINYHTKGRGVCSSHNEGITSIHRAKSDGA